MGLDSTDLRIFICLSFLLVIRLIDMGDRGMAKFSCFSFFVRIDNTKAYSNAFRDKVTSVFIHFAPPLVLFVITHVLPDSYVQERYPGAHRDSVKLISALLVSCITYTIWQILYYYFIQVRKRDKIAAGRPTSFTWLRRSYAKTWLGRMVLRFPEKSQPYCYMTIQFLYTLVTMAPCPIWLKSRMCCGLFLVFVFSCSIWNGASYYFDVLGMKMQNEINRIETQTHDEDSSESGRNSPDSQKFLSADDLQSLKKKNWISNAEVSLYILQNTYFFQALISTIRPWTYRTAFEKGNFVCFYLFAKFSTFSKRIKWLAYEVILDPWKRKCFSTLGFQ